MNKRIELRCMSKLSLLCALLLLAGCIAQAATFEVDWSRVSVGGAMFQPAGQFEIGATVGQPEAGEFGGPGLQVFGGFWGVALTEAGEPDSDRDGLPDDYELAHGLNPGRAEDAARDNDSDGLTNREEFIAGTDPNRRDSVLRFARPAITATGFSLSFPGVAGRTYRVERTDNLGTGRWATIRTVTGGGGVINLVDPLSLAPGSRYYRIVVARPSD
jgi:hypothetical protein